MNIRIGYGVDVHQLAENFPLWIGGLKIESDLGAVGHSDADVLLHAITDAVLSGAGLPDIGQLFPNTDEANRGRDSAEMLSQAMQAVRDAGWELINLDAVVQIEQPKLAHHKLAMRQRIATILDVTVDEVSLKGKTGEGIGEIGRGELATAQCVALLYKTQL